MRAAAIGLAGLALAGCTLFQPAGPPTITFEAKPFLRAYRVQRDGALLRMAPALAKCERTAAVASAELKGKCDSLSAAFQQWYDHDMAVFDAILDGQTKSIDLEQAGALAIKLAKVAADILL